MPKELPALDEVMDVLQLGTPWPFTGVSRALRARNPDKSLLFHQNSYNFVGSLIWLMVSPIIYILPFIGASIKYYFHVFLTLVIYGCILNILLSYFKTLWERS